MTQPTQPNQVLLRPDRLVGADLNAWLAAGGGSGLQNALAVAPQDVCIVPEKREEITTEGGLDVLAQQEKVRRYTETLQQAGITVDCVPLVPQQPYPFPWRFWHFFDTFPESAHLKPAPINPPQIPHNDYDVVVIAYTVWFLAPSQPVTAFLQREDTRRLLAGKPIVTLIGCRNMWLSAQEKMKTLLAANGAKLIGNIVKTDACGTAASFVTTPAWLLSGDKRYFKNLQ